MATLKFGGLGRRLRPWAEVAAQLVEQITSCSKFEGSNPAKKMVKKSLVFFKLSLFIEYTKVKHTNITTIYRDN